MGRVWKLIIAVFAIIGLDQLSKGIVRANFILGESVSVIDGLFSFTYVKNPGAAFGFMANAHESIRKPLFLLIPVIACGWLIYLIWHTRRGNLLLFISYGLILAGAVGNLIDRFLLGYVVDFLDFYVKDSHFPAFNIADSAITIAAILLVMDFFIVLKKGKNKMHIKATKEALTGEDIKQ